MNQLKPIEEQTVHFIRDYIKTNKYAPSVREIAAGTQTSSGSVIHDRLQTIRRKGYIGFVDKTPRALWVTEKGDAL